MRMGVISGKIVLSSFCKLEIFRPKVNLLFFTAKFIFEQAVFPLSIFV